MKSQLTEKGVEKLRRELRDLKSKRRPLVAERIQLAKDFGDLSENAEYQEAKDEQGFIEGRILEIEDVLKNAVVIHIKKRETASIATFGSVVHLIDVRNIVAKYTIVGSTEADPLNGSVSVDSPIGQALIGKKMGDTVTVTTPIGQRLYTITSIL